MYGRSPTPSIIHINHHHQPTEKQGLITVGDLSTMLLYSVYAGFSISALLSYYGDLMKVGIRTGVLGVAHVVMSGIFVGICACLCGLDSVGWR